MEHTEAEIDSVISRQNVSKEGYTTFYVDGATGNDAANFLRWETAAKTIQAAVDKAESWAKIYVAAGTYAENIAIIKDSIHLIGERRANTIIKPASGHSFYITGDGSKIENFKIYSSDVPVIDPYTAAIKASGCEYLTVRKCTLLGESAVQADGIRLLGANRALIEDNIFTNPALYGIYIVPDAGVYNYYNVIRSNHMESNGFRTAIAVWNNSFYTQIYNNDIRNYAVGVHNEWAAAGSQYSSIYHNNFEVNTVDLSNVTALANKWYENYFDSHTIDTNNDGLCDTPYTFITGTDYAPVSKRNGWEQISLGASTSLGGTVNNIFSLVNGILTLTETGAIITTDGTVQTVYINNAPAGVFEPRTMLIDFTAHLAADTIILRAYHRLKSGGGLIKYDEEPITAVQDPAEIIIDFEPNRFGYKVTMEKTAGANHDYDWEVLYKA